MSRVQTETTWKSLNPLNMAGIAYRLRKASITCFAKRVVKRNNLRLERKEQLPTCSMQQFWSSRYPSQNWLVQVEATGSAVARRWHPPLEHVMQMGYPFRFPAFCKRKGSENFSNLNNVDSFLSTTVGTHKITSQSLMPLPHGLV